MKKRKRTKNKVGRCRRCFAVFIFHLLTLGLPQIWSCLFRSSIFSAPIYLVPTAVYISRRHPDPTIWVFLLSETAYCWTSCFVCRWRPCLERASCRRHFSTFSVHFTKTFKTASLFTLLSWPCPLNQLSLFAWSFVVAFCYLGHPKNLFDWLIDANTQNFIHHKIR